MKRRSIRRVAIVSALLLTIVSSSARAQEKEQPPANDEASGQTATVSSDHAGWKGAFVDSFRMLMFQHLWRVSLQEKTRRELGGNFFVDYRRSVRVPPQWSDGDSWVTSYVGHPIQGATTGFIWLENSGEAPVPFGGTKAYMGSRLRAMVWALAWSVQWKIGPVSEASIGNVGLNPKTIGWSDEVTTPVAGWLIILGEDAMDRFAVTKLEHHIGSPVVNATLRMLLNPTRSLANIAGLRAPWFREGRPLGR